MSNFSIKVKIEEAGYNLDALEEGTVEAFQIAVGGIAKAAQQEWVRLAQDRLKTSRADYINGLRQAESFKAAIRGDFQTYEIQLVGRMPNNYEFGMPSFDMKSVRPGWLGGGKALTAKDGHKFIRIPFRHSMSSDARLGYTGKAKAADLKTHLRQTVKAYGLDKMVRSATGQVVEGPTTRVPNKAPGVHPYLRGLTRIQTGTSGTTASGKQKGTSQLMTWRIMSENSPEDSWIHPGLNGAFIHRDVERWIDGQLDRMIETILG